MLKKITSFLLLIFIFYTGNSQITNPSPYCTATFDNNYNMFQNIIINGTSQSFGAMGSWINTNTYKYYNTTVFPNFTKGSNATVTLNVYAVNDAEPTYFALWIDYNQNNTFETSEIVMQNSNTLNDWLPTFGAPVSPITKTFTVPTSALTGVTRARLMRGQKLPSAWVPYDQSYILSSCPTTADNSYGCTYDFNINIVNSLSTAEVIAEDNIKIYPIPASDRITIESQYRPKIIEVFDMNGRLIKAYQKTNVLDISMLKSGEYILNLKLENANLKRKIIVL